MRDEIYSIIEKYGPHDVARCLARWIDDAVPDAAWDGAVQIAASIRANAKQIEADWEALFSKGLLIYFVKCLDFQEGIYELRVGNPAKSLGWIVAWGTIDSLIQVVPEGLDILKYTKQESLELFAKGLKK